MRDMWMMLLNVAVFQIYGSSGGHSEYTNLWTISNIAIRDVFWGRVCNHGKVSLYPFIRQRLKLYRATQISITQHMAR
jgi:hypothetical protein